MKKRGCFAKELSSLLFKFIDMALNSKPNPRFIWGIFMVLVFMGMSFMLIFTNMFMNLSLPIRILTGVIFLIYGIFRGYSIWKNGR